MNNMSKNELMRLVGVISDKLRKGWSVKEISEYINKSIEFVNEVIEIINQRNNNDEMKEKES